MTNKKTLTSIVVLIVLTFSIPYCTSPDNNGSEVVTKPDTIADTNSPATTCPISSTDFASWFSDGSITQNGPINAANSLASLDNSCDFYKWSWQMFLWNTSPLEGSYVFDSPPFYDLEGSKLVTNGSMTKVRGGKVDREGQAGLVSGVLMSQQAGITPDGSLVYYAIHVNDVYAYFLSGQKNGQLDMDAFPTTQAQLDEIEAYAQGEYGAKIEDGQSLAMELKSSWIELPADADRSRFVTISADVPKFEKISDQEWTWDGTSFERDVTLAMVGLHVVGSTAGHPEMVWATFEHVDNTPDVDYFYVNAQGDILEEKTFGVDGLPVKKDWLFNNGETRKNASNQMHMELVSNDITANAPATISPSSTVRTHPWGNAPDSTSAANNTELLSLNQNISDMLLDGDIRKNYFLVGTSWTSNGVPGVGEQIPDIKGSLLLSNSTMETYFQYKNCFSCHQGGDLSGLSHIYGGIDPLPGVSR